MPKSPAGRQSDRREHVLRQPQKIGNALRVVSHVAQHAGPEAHRLRRNGCALTGKYRIAVRDQKRVDLVAPVGIATLAANVHVTGRVRAEDQEYRSGGHELLVAAQAAHGFQHLPVVDDHDAVGLEVARCGRALRRHENKIEGRFGNRPLLVGADAAVRQQGVQDRIGFAGWKARIRRAGCVQRSRAAVGGLARGLLLAHRV
ncbi:MAG: hypothetical protein O3A88_00485 [Proteobacteria bacterium]|nr:hypothetical protein [Pseudomonadota bacterium]